MSHATIERGSTATFEGLTSYRWSSADEADHFPMENPATGALITGVQGGGAAEMIGNVDAEHPAFGSDWGRRPGVFGTAES